MNRIGQFFQLLKLRKAHSRVLIRLERELTENEDRVVGLRAEQLLAKNRIARLVHKRLELDRRFGEAMQDGDTSGALQTSTEASHIVERVGELHAGEQDLRARLVRMLEEREWLKRDRTRALLEKATVTRRLSDLWWGSEPTGSPAAGG